MLIDAAIYSSSFFRDRKGLSHGSFLRPGCNASMPSPGSPERAYFSALREKCAEILRQKIVNKKIYTASLLFSSKKWIDVDKALT
jgi:hypothetical protein